MPTIAAYATAPLDQALATLRYGAAAAAAGWQLIPGKEGRDAIFPERVHQADIVLVQRDFPRFFPAYTQIVQAAREANKPIFYDLDDLLIALPPEHPNQTDYQDALGGMFYALLTADQVIVSTPFLQEVLRPLQAKTAVWPTVLPDTLWPITAPAPAPDTQLLRFGYMGGDSHLPDLAWIWPTLQQAITALNEPVELHLWGCTLPPELTPVPQIQIVYHAGLTGYDQFAGRFGSDAKADIWLAPLQPNLFNRCKSPIKFWEYSAIGGAGIYSDIEPYQTVVQHGENGLLAETADEWVSAIIQLATNPSLRLRLAQNAQQTLKAEGLLSRHLAAWQQLYTTPPASTALPESDVWLTHALMRLSEQVQTRSDERHREVMGFLQRLYEIYESWWWRGWQRAKKIARLDFSPLPHFQPFPQNEKEQ